MKGKMKKIFKFLLAGLAVILLLAVALGVFYVVVPMVASAGGDPGAPSEDGFQPEVVSAEANCGDLDYELEFVADAASLDGTAIKLPDAPGAVELQGDAGMLSWESTQGIDGVIVRGGDKANHYAYAEPEDRAGEWFQDNLLHPPLAPDGEEPPQVTEVLFCYDLDTVEAPEAFGQERVATIWIKKESTLDGAMQEFRFETSWEKDSSFDIEPGESHKLQPDAAAAYTFTETVPSGWALVGIECVETAEAEAAQNNLAAIVKSSTTVYLDAGEYITCTFTNEPETGQLMVVKQIVPRNDPGLVDLIIDGKVEKADASDGDATPLIDVAVGEHTIGESACSGTDLENYNISYRCVKTADLKEPIFAASPYEELNTVFVDPGDVITCTITNTRKTGDVVIKKHIKTGADPSTDGTQFHFTTNVDPSSFALEDDESMLFEDLPVGETATFTETVPDGWQVKWIYCKVEETEASLLEAVEEAESSLLAAVEPTKDIEPVEDMVTTCGFINRAVPFIEVEKTADPKVVTEPGARVTYTVKVTSLGTTGPVTLVGLDDDIYGDVTDDANPDISHGSCALDVTIDPGETYQCSFKGKVEGDAGDSVTDVVTATVEDGQEAEAQASDPATVRIVQEPPDTGAGVPVPMVVGGLAAIGMLLLAAGACVRRSLWLGS